MYDNMQYECMLLMLNMYTLMCKVWMQGKMNVTIESQIPLLHKVLTQNTKKMTMKTAMNNYYRMGVLCRYFMFTLHIFVNTVFVVLFLHFHFPLHSCFAHGSV